MSYSDGVGHISNSMSITWNNHFLLFGSTLACMGVPNEMVEFVYYSGANVSVMYYWQCLGLRFCFTPT